MATSTWTSKATLTQRVARAASISPDSGIGTATSRRIGLIRLTRKANSPGIVADLTKRLDAHPDMHIYHYAPYERTALARLTQRHDVGVLEFDRLLRGETLVDLYGVVRQGLRISKGRNSDQKVLRPSIGVAFVVGDQPDDVADALSSVVAYEKWLVGPDQSILDSIAAYNRDDVRSTHDLHEWLEARRSELEGRHGPFPRPTIPTGTPSVEQTEAEAREAELAARLVEADLSLLAGLVGWHRRERASRAGGSSTSESPT